MKRSCVYICAVAVIFSCLMMVLPTYAAGDDKNKADNVNVVNNPAVKISNPNLPVTIQNNAPVPVTGLVGINPAHNTVQFSNTPELPGTARCLSGELAAAAGPGIIGTLTETVGFTVSSISLSCSWYGASPPPSVFAEFTIKDPNAHITFYVDVPLTMATVDAGGVALYAATVVVPAAYPLNYIASMFISRGPETAGIIYCRTCLNGRQVVY